MAFTKGKNLQHSEFTDFIPYKLTVKKNAFRNTRFSFFTQKKVTELLF